VSACYYLKQLKYRIIFIWHKTCDSRAQEVPAQVPPGPVGTSSVVPSLPCFPGICRGFFSCRSYAFCESVNHCGIAYGLVAPRFEMAKVCANHLAMLGIGRYTGSAVSTKL
jgi:hypothetical protein